MCRYIVIHLLIVMSVMIGGCKKDRGNQTLQIDCRLALENQDSDIEAHLVFTNSSTIPLEIPESKLLAGGKMTWDAFEITLDGERVSYMCIMVLPDPNKIREVTLAPGETYESTTNLSGCYEIEKPGTYEVRYCGHIWCKSAQQSINVISNTERLSGTKPY